jgi:hypothetical protein
MLKFSFAQGSDDENILSTFPEPMGELFMTEQMSLKRGLKEFGEDGANAVIDELKQLDYHDAIKLVRTLNVNRTPANLHHTLLV